MEYDITLVANGSVEDVAEFLGTHISFMPLQIERKICLKKDIIALVRLFRLFRKEKFDSVHSIMPKSGVLAMVAARLAGVPLRFHTFTGQVWSTQKGLTRLLLKFLDRVLSMNATRVLADSHSQRLFLIENNTVKESSIDVLAEGSIAGVDTDRFKYNPNIRHRIRENHQIPNDAVIFLFLGRLSHDKGLMDLARAFTLAAGQDNNIHLLIVGPDEDGLEDEFTILAQRFIGRVHRYGFTDFPEDYMAAADVFCMPSYREGFGTVIIEAASVGLPAIASRIYGIVDAVEDGVTGILHVPTSEKEIAEAMLLFSSNGDIRRKMGSAARARVVDKFSEARVTRALADFYRGMFYKTPIKSK